MHYFLSLRTHLVLQFIFFPLYKAWGTEDCDELCSQLCNGDDYDLCSQTCHISSSTSHTATISTDKQIMDNLIGASYTFSMKRANYVCNSTIFHTYQDFSVELSAAFNYSYWFNGTEVYSWEEEGTLQSSNNLNSLLHGFDMRDQCLDLTDDLSSKPNRAQPDDFSSSSYCYDFYSIIKSSICPNNYRQCKMSSYCSDQKISDSSNSLAQYKGENVDFDLGVTFRAGLFGCECGTKTTQIQWLNLVDFDLGNGRQFEFDENSDVTDIVTRKLKTSLKNDCINWGHFQPTLQPTHKPTIPPSMVGLETKSYTFVAYLGLCVPLIIIMLGYVWFKCSHRGYNKIHENS